LNPQSAMSSAASAAGFARVYRESMSTIIQSTSITSERSRCWLPSGVIVMKHFDDVIHASTFVSLERFAESC
jgi:hypothetical protein